MNKLKLLWYRFVKNIYQEDIDYFEIKEFLEKKFPKCRVEITDLRKKCCSYKLIKELSRLIPSKYLKYEKEIRDCEDISIIAWGVWKFLFPRLPIGLVFVDRKKDKHALLCALYKTKSGRVDFTFIETQTGNVSYFDYEPYLIVI